MAYEPRVENMTKVDDNQKCRLLVIEQVQISEYLLNTLLVSSTKIIPRA
jgi:hypothetical protein